MDDINKIFSVEPKTFPQIRDKIFFALGVCTLARSCELTSMNVEDLSLQEDGIMVVIRRRKSAVFRAIQTIWVCGKFFGWDLLSNLKNYLSIIPPSGSLWRSIAPQQKQLNPKCNATNASTLNCIPRNMAQMIKTDHPEEYTSHSLRRTGATLLALMGRTEEQIKVMGNWTSSSAASRYIGISDVSMKLNAAAIAGGSFFRCDLIRNVPIPEGTNPDQLCPSSSAVPDNRLCPPNQIITEETSDCDTVVEPPCAKKRRCSGFIFTGSVQQVIIVSSKDDIPAFPAK